MTPTAITFLVLSIVIIWGGLIASTIFFARKSELSEYPPELADEADESDPTDDAGATG